MKNTISKHQRKHLRYLRLIDVKLFPIYLSVVIHIKTSGNALQWLVVQIPVTAVMLQLYYFMIHWVFFWLKEKLFVIWVNTAYLKSLGGMSGSLQQIFNFCTVIYIPGNNYTCVVRGLSDLATFKKNILTGISSVSRHIGISANIRYCRTYTWLL